MHDSFFRKWQTWEAPSSHGGEIFNFRYFLQVNWIYFTTPRQPAKRRATPHRRR